jgi:TatD DNase family protein
MIDVHCHLSQPDYQGDIDQVIEKCKQQLKAVITCCAHPNDFDLTLQLVEKYKGFVFATASIHPIYIKEIDEKQKNEFFDLLKKYRNNIIGIGETGLDFNIEEEKFREKQKELFIEFIELSKDLQLPVVIHARGAFKEAIEILENRNVKNVLMHFFSARDLLERVIKNDWYISVNTALLRSKKLNKIVRDMPIERILTETDSPWLGLEGRNDPAAVKLVVEKIAEVKKMNFDDVDKITTQNATKLFNLP